jgi:hypothetical protein
VSCWNSFCVANPCGGVTHLDVTGFTWDAHQPTDRVLIDGTEQYRGTRDECEEFAYHWRRKLAGRWTLQHRTGSEWASGESAWTDVTEDAPDWVSVE